MKVELDTLLDELARRHARGEPLDVEGTLAKAGDRADELAPLIEAFLLRAPRRAPSDESLAYVRSLDDPPMTRARVAKALKVDDVVDAIVTACEVRPEARPKVRRYYQQLEGGILDPSRVAASVWDAITGLLGRPRWTLIAPRIDTMLAQAEPMYRADKLFDPSELPIALGVDVRSQTRRTRSTRCSSATRASRGRRTAGSGRSGCSASSLTLGRNQEVGPVRAGLRSLRPTQLSGAECRASRADRGSDLNARCRQRSNGVLVGETQAGKRRDPRDSVAEMVEIVRSRYERRLEVAGAKRLDELVSLTAKISNPGGSELLRLAGRQHLERDHKPI